MPKAFRNDSFTLGACCSLILSVWHCGRPCDALSPLEDFRANLSRLTRRCHAKRRATPEHRPFRVLVYHLADDQLWNPESWSTDSIPCPLSKQSGTAASRAMSSRLGGDLSGARATRELRKPSPTLGLAAWMASAPAACSVASLPQTSYLHPKIQVDRLRLSIRFACFPLQPHHGRALLGAWLWSPQSF